ncbi:MAG TPA: FAD-dependent oxidoreductase, partial [Cellvibrionaceae bacterium]|nr:FAD-dependent oxidoreductase [Cellvibrionaceae bacterium]
MSQPLPVAIIGGGLCGVYLAWLLQKQGIQFQLFESAVRMGGRILSQNGFDLGPTWYWPHEHRQLDQLLQQLTINTLPQWQSGLFLYQTSRELPAQVFKDPAGYGQAKRISGGAQVLIQTLLNAIDPAAINFGHHLVQINQHPAGVELVLSECGTPVHTIAAQAVLAMPPRLIQHTIKFNPPLDKPLRTIMGATPTWMAGQAKVIFEFAEPFWRAQGLSGNAIAQYPGAILGELFDACSQNQFALGAFLALPPHLRINSRANWSTDLEGLMRAQLIHLFGPAAAKVQAIWFKDWFCEALLSCSEDAVPPSQHPSYNHPWLQLDHWSERLYFAGTETARQHGG